MAKRGELVKGEAEVLKSANEPIVLTEQQRADGVKTYEGKVDYFRSKEQNTLRDILTLYWEKGQFVSDLQMQPQKYGSKTTENFAKDVGSSPEQVRTWYRFYVTYNTPEEVQRLVTLKLPWKGVQALLTGSLKEEDRRKLEVKLSKNEISSEELSTKVGKIAKKAKLKAKKDGKKVDDRGGLHPRRALANLATAVEYLSNRLTKAMGALDEMKDAKDKGYERILEAKKEADKAIEGLKPKIERYLEMSGKV